jgi:hypothetical protein
MKRLLLLPCLLLATMLAAQTDSSVPRETNSAPAEQTESAPAAVTPAPIPVPQTNVPVPASHADSPVPAGTALIVRLETTLATFSNRPGDPFRGSLSQPVVVHGQTLLPAGAIVEGRVTKISEPRRISGRPTIGILPEAVILPSGERYYLDATLTDTNIKGADVNSEGLFKGTSHDRRDTIEQGGGAAGGMLVGGLVGGPVGVLVGGAIGAGATTGHWLAKHRSATLPAGTQLTLELNRALTMTTPTAANAASK